jgi:hypothetical protein
MPAAVPRVERTCIQCGATFLVLASKITGDYKALFCNRGCASLHRRGRVTGRTYVRLPRETAPCAWCGTEVSWLPSPVRDASRRYCSVRCANKGKRRDRLAEIEARLASGSQTCRTCGVEKPLSDFALRRDSGLPRPDCTRCRSDEKNFRRTAAQYGVSVEQYRDLRRQQRSRCGICEQEVEGRHMAVDHDHATGAIRGLLCQRCNLGLGYFLDDPKLLRRAIAYLHR